MSQKICITTLEFPPDVGGVGESVYRISQMAMQMGYEVHVAVFNSRDYQSAQTVERGGVRTSNCDGIVVHRLHAAIRGSDRRAYDFSSEIYFQLKQLHQQHQFDLLHAFFLAETGFVTALLGREANIPIVSSIRGSDLHKHIFTPKNISQISWTLENSDWVTSVSQDLLHRATVLVPSLQGKSCAFLNSIQPIEIDQLPAPAMADKLRGTVIGSVGRFREKKGLEYLFDACRSFKDELDFTLLLVGDFASRERDYWLQELRDSELGDRVVVTGMVSRLEALAYLPLMNIFAIPSLHDGCPNAMLEAMLASRAIVGSSADAIGEILVDGENGAVVAPASTSDLERALRLLLTRPDLRSQYGRAARQTALTKLNPTVERQNWQRVYERILGQTPAPVPVGAAA